MSHMAHPSCACAAPSSVSERVVFAGHAEPHIFIADEEANVAIGAELAGLLGSQDAVEACFSAADFAVLQLRFSVPAARGRFANEKVVRPPVPMHGQAGMIR